MSMDVKEQLLVAGKQLGKCLAGYRDNDLQASARAAVDLGKLMLDAADEIDRLRSEHGWLIEHGGSPTSAPLYWCGGNEWYADHMRAIRFAREIDAAKVKDYIDYGVDHGHRVAEHGWD